MIQKGEIMKNNGYEWRPPRIGEKRENEVSVYTVAIGNFKPFAIGKQKRVQEQVIDFLKSLEGFIGVYPYYPKGTLCLFKTENDAKRAKNSIRAKGIQTGNNIGEVYVDKKYLS